MADFRERIKGFKKSDVSQGDYPPFFQFEESGDWVEGKLSDVREIEQSDGRKSKVMTLITPDNEKYSIGLSADLQGLAKMEGKTVVIKYDGMKKAGKFYMKKFEVYIE